MRCTHPRQSLGLSHGRFRQAKTPAVTKAVVPAAGLGTRFLPATKATPKEMLPVVDKPAIQYVVEEAVKAGLNDIFSSQGAASARSRTTSTGRTSSKRRLPPRRTGTSSAWSASPASSPRCTTSARATPRGWATPCYAPRSTSGTSRSRCCSATTSSTRDDPLLTEMIAVREQHGGSVLALMEVDPEEVSLYGCAAIAPTAEDGVVTSPTWSRSLSPGTRPAGGS